MRIVRDVKSDLQVLFELRRKVLKKLTSRRVSLTISLSFIVIFFVFRNGYTRLSRKICASEDDDNFVSTCNCRSDNRGFHQKVISYSIFGDLNNLSHFSRYVAPMQINVETIKKVYPEWTVRIYSSSNDSEGYTRLKDMFKPYSHVDFCDTKLILGSRNMVPNDFPMTWRFLPLLDARVDHFLSRDSDSLVLNRETEAVSQWLSGSNHTFHVMRDHHAHCTIFIPGGLWGAKIAQKRDEIVKASKHLFNLAPHINIDVPPYGVDQHLLNLHILPLARNDMMAHDSYCCATFPTAIPFPSKRPDNETYVGKVYAKETVRHPALITCPEACRLNANWTFC